MRNESLPRAYFRSGWAFFIPYLGVYLVYAGLHWPVNATPGPAPSTGLPIPALLHVYWMLHALHLLLAGITLGTYLKQCRSSDLNGLIWRLAPWLLLGLVFWIPGTYLEYPTDPWEHFGRITRWAAYALPEQHTYWAKSSYFLAYSLIGTIESPTTQIRGLDAYYTVCCLLLSWQYYRLSRAVGLGRPASFVFTLLTTLTFGNNLFGFYRYYGTSSTVVAQLAAVALVRLAVIALQSAASDAQTPAWRTIPGAARCAGIALLLTLLIGFNHVQGFTVAGLGVLAVIAFQLVSWRRTMAVWLAVAALVVSCAMVYWYPLHPGLENYRQQGWLTAWYGFNLLSPASPAFDRAAVILGLFGFGNLVAAIALLRRNPLVAWLTLVPVVTLMVPAFSIPLSNILATAGEIGIFNRILLAIPTGLALVALGSSWFTPRQRAEVAPSPAPVRKVSAAHPNFPRLAWLAFLVLPCALVLSPASRTGFGRAFNALMRVPDDLSMRPTLVAVEMLRPQALAEKRVFIASTGQSFVASAAGMPDVIFPERFISQKPTAASRLVETYLGYTVQKHIPAIFLPQTPTGRWTPFSVSGHISQHWRPNIVALQGASEPELERGAYRTGFHRNQAGGITYFINLPPSHGAVSP